MTATQRGQLQTTTHKCDIDIAISIHILNFFIYLCHTPRPKHPDPTVAKGKRGTLRFDAPNTPLLMQQSIDLLRHKLEGVYPPGEITGFIRLIFEALCNYTPTDILLRKDTILSEDMHRKIEEIAERLVRQEPIQYILGYAWFCDHRFEVAPGALIPRPETEELVRLIIAENHGRPLHIADLGTGSGCIAVTLARELPLSQVEAWELSPAALAVARRNADKQQVTIDFHERDILRYNLSQIPAGSLDLIVSNPPYVLQSERKTMSGNVLDYEPHEALFVPDDTPLLFYDKIARDGLTLLSPGGRLYFEINETQGENCARMLQGYGYKQTRIIKDLYNKDRFASAVKPNPHG